MATRSRPSSNSTSRALLSSLTATIMIVKLLLPLIPGPSCTVADAVYITGIYNYADELIARYKAGHMIGAHTWDHSDITTLSADQLHQQITLVRCGSTCHSQGITCSSGLLYSLRPPCRKSSASNLGISGL